MNLMNELTSKISCYGNQTNNITTNFYSINITGSTKSTNPSIPGTYESHTPQTFHSIDSRSTLPQYAHSGALNNDSRNVSKMKEPKSNVYIEISNGYSDDNKTEGDDKIINLKMSSSLISSNVDKAHDGQKDFDVNHQDLNRYIHNLMRERLDRLSDQFVR